MYDRIRVGVIDYGVGNHGSMLRALEQLRVIPVLVTRASEIHQTDRLVLPGVGNFTDCISLLANAGWIAALQNDVLGYKKPLLGVCLGMQLLADSSSEGAAERQDTPGLGFIPGRVQHISNFVTKLRVPHVGWNCITRALTHDPLFKGIHDRTDFYFVHSYTFVTEDQNDVLAITDYGAPLTAAVRRGHITGTQFHPEKSSRAGLQVLQNFIDTPSC